MKVIFNFIISFSVLFISLDVLGRGADLLAAADEFKKKDAKKLIRDSIYFSFFVFFGLIITGQLFFKLLSITVVDFQIAAGIVLFLMQLNFLKGRKEPVLVFKDFKIFPRPVFLIGGLQVVIVAMVLAGRLGIIPAGLALTANMYVSSYMLKRYAKIEKILGQSSRKFLSYVFNILLAGFAFMLIRAGLLLVTGIVK